MSARQDIRRIRTLLIANRGEIACRIIGTCRRLGIETVAVYSDADIHARHVALADRAVAIGPAAASESYLRIDKILEAAKATGADAVHPGYGFLSENPDFADACDKAGVIFIGPPASAIRAMALKDASKALMAEAGVPVVPGYHGEDQSLSRFKAEADTIGYPVLVKAVAGGGGKGMRLVDQAQDLEAAIASARREAANSFGNDHLLIEKFVTSPRHIEVQVFGDAHDNAVHLFERDCSIQRRHQKVVEEAPAPGMPPVLRAAMGTAAVKAAASIGYQGAGTVEFIVDGSGGLHDETAFYFMEMNTRLQVEHPVSELVTGLDFVEWQIRVAEGAPLPLTQDGIDVRLNGHAIEARLYAEDPFRDFLPQTGTLGLFDPDAAVEDGCRVDAGVRAGDDISVHYDPMIAKLIAWGPDRETATVRLQRLIAATPVAGLATNRDFLARILGTARFQDAVLDTGFIAAEETALLTPPTVGAHDYARAVLAILAARQYRHGLGRSSHPWDTVDGFRLNLADSEQHLFETVETESGTELTVTSIHHADGWRISVGTEHFDGAACFTDASRLTLSINRISESLFADVTDTHVTLIGADRTLTLPRHSRTGSLDDGMEGPGTITAPMPGKILEVLVKDGDSVTKGDALIVMEAMKMEQTLAAPRDGIVHGLSATPGVLVGDGETLLHLDEQN
ncbi:acetyl/propionyl/methylcrotonyl-CoA carboxylase subunit alpha [Eilatimonas milleporae]|uniref:3-methylcrotonoyl-CoA carboxylase alpha subunit n=1 Tax=Eilatimonas milleporae TaxID=911205 RepID=A0A3M0CNU9_9PROT|nr:acetyl/propionyl/methylcrotonyl-CoA carboxylase subunit alpha [Eilatimonas milleporae]RMB08476.1 3-methylcrotonoyl-CoA carboxylase alpha subunit [Eilatimonas milleporae]